MIGRWRSGYPFQLISKQKKFLEIGTAINFGNCMCQKKVGKIEEWVSLLAYIQAEEISWDRDCH